MSGNLYVTDTFHVQVFSPDGRFLFKWGSRGKGEGQFGTPGQPIGPYGISVGPSGNVCVVDPINHRVQVFGPDGRFLLKWGSEGGGDGQFLSPRCISVDLSGRVYVADTVNTRVQVFEIELPAP